MGFDVNTPKIWTPQTTIYMRIQHGRQVYAVSHNEVTAHCEIFASLVR